MFFMKKISYFLILILFFAGKIFAQDLELSGRVIDEKTKENLAFVSIVYNSKNQGLISDLNGKFEISKDKKVEFLKFSYIGYEAKFISKKEINDKPLVIKLKSKNIEIEEITVFAKENPAHRIIKLVTKNRDKNNPEKMKSFSYTSYNKLIITTDYLKQLSKDTTFTNTLDTASTSADSAKVAAKKLFEAQHLFLMESVSERSFLRPDRNKEEVIASRTSGFANKSFTLLATQLQSLSFYDDFIRLSELTYLNPVSKGSTRKYFFDIKDTILDGKDSIFVIYYRPKKGSKFKGLQGTLHINTNNYAISSVIAEPNIYSKSESIAIKIQQKYNFIEKNGQKAWFPTQLNTDLIFNSESIAISDGSGISIKLIGIGKSYLKNIELNPELNKKEFGHIALEVKEDAHKKTDEFWKEYREDSLSNQEKETYHVVDSAFKAGNIESKLWIAETLLKGYIPIYFLDLKISEIFRYNQYEGFGLGLGAMTNDKISKWFSLGGYFSYGFGKKDKSFKYGGDAQIYLDKFKENKFYFSYSDDVYELGGYSFFKEDKFTSTGIFTSDAMRMYMIKNMFRQEKKQIGFEFRALDYVQGNLFFAKKRKYLKNYFYENDENITKKYLHQTEIGLQFRYAFREQYAVLFNNKISMGTKYPVLWLNLSKGIKDLDGTFEYNKIEAKVYKTFLNRIFGKTYLQLFAGYIDGSVSKLDLYNGHGSYSTRIFLEADNSFNTMKLNEFYVDKFAHCFFKQTFGKIPINMGFFNPRISLMQSVGFGFLSDKNQNELQEYKLQSYEKGYFETGLLLDNILDIKSFSSLGLGIFYKYGEYASNKPANNIFFKASVRIDI